MMMKLLSVVLAIALVATTASAEDCVSKSRDCSTHIEKLKDDSQSFQNELKEFCEVTMDCTSSLKELCPLGTAGEEMMDKLEEKLSEICNNAGLLSNNFWIMITMLIFLIAMRKEF